jgi:hypothetical protein
MKSKDTPASPSGAPVSPLKKPFIYVRFFEHRDLDTPTERYPLTTVDAIDSGLCICDRAVDDEIKRWMKNHPQGKVDFVID